MQHVGHFCPSPSPRVCTSSCPLSWWCQPTISSSVSPFSCPQSFLAWIFSRELALCIRWPRYWSFTFRVSLSNEYSGLISFRVDWFGLRAICRLRDSQESSPTPQSESINSSALILLYGPNLTSVCDYWKKSQLWLYGPDYWVPKCTQK